MPNDQPQRQLTVQLTSRDVIERRLLAALDSDSDQVAVLVTKEDLNMLIHALAEFGTVMSRQWSADLQRLRREAFG